MTDADDLLAIANEVANMEHKVFNSLQGAHFLRPEDARQFDALVVEATAIIKDHLGPVNDFTFAIADATRMNGAVGGVSSHCIGDVEQHIRAAARHIRRVKRDKAPAPVQVPLQGVGSQPTPYVSPSRIAEIEALKSGKWNFAKLAQLCKELNVAHAKECNYATAMLVRAITDHVPPVFGVTSFAQVAANYAGTQSFKKSMQHLQGSLRNIADGLLHEQIRPRESLPSPQQVDFRQDLDRLLSEIVRIAE